MHPAISVILFTTLSGLGFGMMMWLGAGIHDVQGVGAFIFCAIAMGLAIAGLISSLFHLGNPQRFMKAFSQWRTSWLSREGIASVAALTTFGLYAFTWIFFGKQFAWLGLLSSLLSLITVFCTAMIYAQMKTIPRWNHWLTIAIFITASFAGGALLTGQLFISAIAMIALLLVLIAYWWRGATAFKASGHSMETATGLTDGKVRLLEKPHSGETYLTKEMVHVIGRKHAQKLRIIAMILLVLPILAILFFPHMGHAWGVLLILSHAAGIFISRWLFFAEAEHVVGLYYGAHDPG